jgi:hypothetical protein
MKKLTGALVLSLSLLMTSGCRSCGETRHSDLGDASTPSSAETSPSLTGPSNTKTPLGQEAGGPTGTKPTLDADSGGMKPGSGTATLSDAERQAQESCLDQFAKDKKLDRYGNAEGTMYAGGSPLFDERTGESRDRLDYFYERQPEAKKACAASKEAPPKKTK